MPFVIDASVAAAWVLPDESDPIAEQALERLLNGGALHPPIWWYEIHNIFVVNERRGRLQPAHTAQALDRLSVLPLKSIEQDDPGRLLRLARRYSLTFYDAAYLGLAEERGIPLATLDRRLVAAARAADVALLS